MSKTLDDYKVSLKIDGENGKKKKKKRKKLDIGGNNYTA